MKKKRKNKTLPTKMSTVFRIGFPNGHQNKGTNCRQQILKKILRPPDGRAYFIPFLP